MNFVKIIMLLIGVAAFACAAIYAIKKASQRKYHPIEESEPEYTAPEAEKKPPQPPVPTIAEYTMQLNQLSGPLVHLMTDGTGLLVLKEKIASGRAMGINVTGRCDMYLRKQKEAAALADQYRKVLEEARRNHVPVVDQLTRDWELYDQLLAHDPYAEN